MQSTFPFLLKLANVTPVHKKGLKTSEDHYRPVSIYMRDLCSSKFLNILSHSFQNFSAVLGKILAPSSVFCGCLRNGN